MTVDELIEELNRLKNSNSGIGSMVVMGNHPGSGYPWGEIKKVEMWDNQPHSPYVCVDQGME